MIVDLHNHTFLCNHAEGTPTEYVEEAIKRGIAVFGFSDHNPMEFDPKYRMKFEEISTYFNLIDEVAEKYRGKIEILKGFEVDYIPQYLDSRVLENSSIDYLIGSIHFLDGWGFDNPEFIGEYQNRDIDSIWVEYFSKVEEMANSKLFQIVGHIDLIKVFKFLPKKLNIRDLVEKPLQAIKRSNMAVELNGAGYRKPIGELYPSREILEMVYEMDIPITIGSDAHSPKQVGLFLDRTIKEAKEIGFDEVAIFRKREMEMVKI